jgi:hypothetical protein
MGDGKVKVWTDNEWYEAFPEFDMLLIQIVNLQVLLLSWVLPLSAYNLASPTHRRTPHPFPSTK